LAVPDVGVEVGVVEVSFLLEDRQRARGVDDDLGVVCDGFALSGADNAGDGAVVGLGDILDDGIVVDLAADTVGLLQ